MEDEPTRTSMKAPEEAEEAATIAMSRRRSARVASRTRARRAFEVTWAVLAPESGLNAGEYIAESHSVRVV